MNNPDDNKTYPFPYDYWVDRENKLVYAVIEYNNKQVDYNHSNLYLVSTEYQGK